MDSGFNRLVRRRKAQHRPSVNFQESHGGREEEGAKGGAEFQKARESKKVEDQAKACGRTPRKDSQDKNTFNSNDLVKRAGANRHSVPKSPE